MITKEQFVETIKQMKAFEVQQFELNRAINIYSGGYEKTGISNGRPLWTCMRLLQNIFNDDIDNSVLELLIVDKFFLEDYHEGDIVYKGEKVDCSTWEKVYDFLVRMYEDKQRK